MKYFALWGALLFAAPGIRFDNVAREAGLVHSFPNGGETSKQFIIETTGSGVAFIDYDNDGLLDIFVASGSGGTSRLYHNDGGGKFKDVTEPMGLKQSGWAQGVCAGDYDNDGYTDLFVTYWGANHLYRNAAGKHFEDATERAHLTQDRTRYNTGCAFLDYDNDGKLDLFVANYLKFDPKTTPKVGENPYCYYREIAVNCGPRGLPFDRNILYHGKADGTFEDVSDQSGIAAPNQNYSLGVLTGDFNNDGLVDIYVACDQTPSLLYINQGNGKFEEEGLLRGVAFDSNGKSLSGMGATAADYDGDGTLDIFRSNFSDERETLYRAQNSKGEFEDVTIAAGLARNTRFVGWGCGFFDFDNDGWKDLLIANGHVFPEVERLRLDIHYKDRAILYRNLGNGKFEDISEAAGPGIVERHSARGAAFGDYDNDGRVEVLINNQNEPPSLLKLAGPNGNHWVILKLAGTRSNRSALGAKVRLTAGGRTQLDEVRSGGSYLSQSDLRLHFGLGSAAKIDEVRIDWPGGGHQVERNVPVDRVVAITESAGPVAAAFTRLIDSLTASNLEAGLQAAELLREARPSLARRVLEHLGPEMTARYYMDAGDMDRAADFAREAGATASVQELLNRMPPRQAADLFAALLSDMPASIGSRRDVIFLARNLDLISGVDRELAGQAAERVVASLPADEALLRYTGHWLQVHDPGRFAHWKDKLSSKAGVRDGGFTFPAPKPREAIPDTPELRTLGEAIRDEIESAFMLHQLKGKAVVVSFWATWCLPCRREIPPLERIARETGTVILGVSDEPASVVQKFAQENGFTFRTLQDGDRQLHDRFEVSTLPLMLLFDREGRLVKRLADEQSEEGLRRELSHLSSSNSPNQDRTPFLRTARQRMYNGPWRIPRRMSTPQRTSIRETY